MSDRWGDSRADRRALDRHIERADEQSALPEWPGGYVLYKYETPVGYARDWPGLLHLIRNLRYQHMGSAVRMGYTVEAL